jgi:16S rRNA (uracil1498-N3)-methyltransferase
MSPPRFYLSPAPGAGEQLRLAGREAYHALRVLRIKRGDAVSILDGAGVEFSCVVENTGRETLELAVKERKSTAPPRCPITLLVGMPKGKIIEGIIQKSVELGARRITPLLTERVVARLDGAAAEHKHEKLRQVAIEAIKQCGAAWLPEIEEPTPIDAMLARKEKFDLALAGSLQTERRHPHEWLREFESKHGRRPREAAVWIGPEGDFTPDELHRIEAAGALPITLGPLTLRVETAAIYCLSFLNYELNA